MSENKIDELFKKGLTESGIPFEEAHWRDMKKKLEQDGNRRRDIIYWTSLGGAAAMFIMALAWWFTFPETVKTNNVVKNSPAEIKTQPEPVIQEAAKSASSEAIVPQQASLKRQSVRIKSAAPEQYLPAMNNTNFNKGITGLVQTTIQQDNLVSIVPQKEAGVLKQNADNAYAKDPIVTPPAAADNIIAQSAKPVIKDDSSRISVKKVPGFRPSIILSITAAPDLSAVNSFSGSKRGFNGGILATASLSPKLSITTGAVLAKKVYETPFSNYKPGGTYVFPVSPLDVSADCRVLDIPLNLNYSFINKASTKIGFSAGASSYMMLSEDYAFEYQNPYAKSPKSYYVRNQNQHYLGVANLAISYEKKLNNNASITLQPFAKLPLTQIGNGNVKLMSAGVSANLNINISNIAGRKP